MATNAQSSQPSQRLFLGRAVTRRSVVTGGATLAVLAAASLARPAYAGLFDSFVKSVEAVSDAATSISRPLFLSSAAADDGDIQEPSAGDYPWESDLSNVINLDYLYLSERQISCLSEKGFVQSLNAASEFFELYEDNRYNLDANFVTVDSLVHTYHLYFAYLLRSCERGSLSQALLDVSERMLQVSVQQAQVLAGTEWESAAQLVCGFFGVGLALLSADSAALAQLSDEVRASVEAELALITEASGIYESPLFAGISTGQGTAVEEDYSQYKPRGYYAGEAALESYFRAMMWYGRRNFTQTSEVLDRAALLITLGLAGPDEQAAALWEKIYEVTSFFVGTSDDNGYFEYLPLAQSAYGADASVESLVGNDAAWQQFHELTAQLPAPQINSVPVYDEGEDADHLAQNAGFRFMGQRFTLDESIFQQLIYNKVGERDDGARRMLPDVLDVPASLGSTSAYAILQEQGDTTYPRYEENLAQLQAAIAEAPSTLWQASLYAQWLNMLRPLLAEKGSGYPLAMQGDAWARKNLQTFGGGYAELKHDTVLYAKQVIAEAGGGMIEERDDRGYVEPEPRVFARMSALVQATSAGLSAYGMLSEADAESLSILQQLCDQLKTIANKELRDELPSDEEFELIRSIGVQLEHFWQLVHEGDAGGESFTTTEFPAAIVTDIATDPNGSVLEVGTGDVSRLYVIVPVGGVLRVASGPVFSFYQFAQPLDQRLTDSTWRQMLGIQTTEDGGWLDNIAVLTNVSNTVAWVKDFTVNWWEDYDWWKEATQATGEEESTETVAIG